jgi:hypothetical protein
MENSSNQTKRSTTSGYIYPKYKQYRDSLAKKLREDWQNPKLNNIDITKFSPSQIERLKSQCRREILESVQQTEEYQQARTAKNAARKNELEELVESLVDSTGMTAKAARYVVYGKKETPTTTPEKMGTLEQQMVNHILATNGNRVNQLKTTGFLDIEGGDKIQTHLTKAEKDQLRPLAQSDITEVTPVEKTYQGEQYHIITCKIRGEQYTAIQVPNKLKTMKYQNTHIGQQLMLFKGRHFYPAFLTDEKLANPLDQDRLIRKTEPAMQADGTPHTNIKLYTDGNQE